jgi:hypothetical protein
MAKSTAPLVVPTNTVTLKLERTVAEALLHALMQALPGSTIGTLPKKPQKGGPLVVGDPGKKDGGAPGKKGGGPLVVEGPGKKGGGPLVVGGPGKKGAGPAAPTRGPIGKK